MGFSSQGMGKKDKIKFKMTLLLISIISSFSPHASFATTYTVTNTSASPATAGSLSNAIATANTSGTASNIINFSPALAGQTILQT